MVTVIDSRIEEKKMKDERDDELLWDGGCVVPKSKEADGFDAPDINFLGHSFRFVCHIILFTDIIINVI